MNFLDEVHLIVNLYSFPLPLVSQANTFFPKVTHLSHLTGKTIPKLPLCFCQPLFFEDISTPMVESTKWSPLSSRLA